MVIPTSSSDAGPMMNSNEDEHRPRIRYGIFRRLYLILLIVIFFGVTMAQAQGSLEDLQKRKMIAEAEKAAIEAEIARDEARKKLTEFVAPLDPAMKVNDAVEATYSAKATADAQAAQSTAPSLCLQCLEAAQEELKQCLASAISQEDKKSCLEKKDTRVKSCDTGECKIERALTEKKGTVPSEKK